MTQKANTDRAKLFRAARRVVIKIGTNVVAQADGSLCAARVEPIVAAIAELKRDGRQVVLVSSGAVGLGRGRLGLHRTRTDDLVTRQACAAVGQALLMHEYERLFSACGLQIAQVLLTEDDFTDRRRSSNLRHTMEKLLKLGVVPVVNENDTVSTAELEYLGDGARTRVFSDNDRLAALVASRLDANALVLLTNVDGLLRVAPGQGEVEKTEDNGPIPVVPEITPELKALAAGPAAGGRGGMLTKLEAAEIVTRAGGLVAIANGTEPSILERVFRGETLGTLFLATSRMAGKRRWIAYAADVRGRVVVNAGAQAALLGGKASLLWSGVVDVDRHFRPMDVISIAGPDGREFARGIANHGSDENREAMPGKSCSAKASVLVTRDNILVFEKQ